MSFGDERDPVKQIRWIEFRNASGQAIPSFGVLQITGSEVAGVGRKVLTVTRPDGTAGASYAINGPMPVAAGSTNYGVCTLDWPAVAAYDTGDGTPAINEIWGAKSGQFLLAKGNPGFSIAGTPENGRVLITKSSASGMILGKTDSAITKGSSGTISIYSDESTDTGENLTATNLFANLDSGKWVIAVEIGGTWYLVAGECD